MITVLKLEIFTASPRSKVQLKGNAPWVARLVALDRSGKFVRRFVDGETDYSQSNSVGSRGVYRYYHLRPGSLYEVCKRTSWQRVEQYFCRVRDGEVVRMTRQEVLGALEGTQDAAIPAMTRGVHDGD